MNRRSFLKYVGLGAAAGALQGLGPLEFSTAAAAQDAADGGNAWVGPAGEISWKPVPYPVPLASDGGDAATDAQRLATFEVKDDIVLPAGFAYKVIAQWGDTFGPSRRPEQRIRFGYNCDYTALVTMPGRGDDFWLVVNHEYISARPWLQGYEKAHGEPLLDLKMVPHPDPRGHPQGRLQLATFKLTSHELDLQDRRATIDVEARALLAARSISAAALEELGITSIHVHRGADGSFSVVNESPLHHRVTGAQARNPTFANCSGATTPWGTVLSCEENFQDQVPEWVTPTGALLTDVHVPFAGLGYDGKVELPFEFGGLGQGLRPVLDGRDFGWVCEFDPTDGRLVKHKALGRFRHENVALRTQRGKPIAAYMGDDRRGGHLWKYVSKEDLGDAGEPGNSRLLGQGTLHVAQLRADGTGRWIPLRPDTPLARPDPQRYATGHLLLPRRAEGGPIAVGTPESAHRQCTAEQWIAAVETFTGKPLASATLGDLIRAEDSDKQNILLLDAFLMGNAAGGTPTARPEDIELHPLDQSIYVAFTDNTGDPEGCPDKEIFPDSAGTNSRQYGSIYRLVEDNDDPASLTFTWGKFVASGEVSDGGAGFACADNLAFDPQGNLWMVTDITTKSHNHAVNRAADNVKPGGNRFPGIFGNNALFVIPTRGPNAGVPYCFATSPVESEFTGITFTADGRTLILSVQHPGELHGTRGRPENTFPAQDSRQFVIADRAGKLFTQTRTIPLGSNFPAAKMAVTPRPCVVCITRR